MKRALFVIDMQKFFIKPWTKYLPERICQYIKLKRRQFDLIIFTNFVNHPKSNVSRFLKWKESMKSPEIDLADELQPILQYGIAVSKNVYSALKAQNVKKLLKKNKIKEIYLCGMDTDCCILATAYDAFDCGYKVYLIESLIASHAGASLHNAGLAIFNRNLKSLA